MAMVLVVVQLYLEIVKGALKGNGVRATVNTETNGRGVTVLQGIIYFDEDTQGSYLCALKD